MTRAQPGPGGMAARGARQPDEGLLLARARSRDAGAREQAVRRWMPLVRALAGRYRRAGEPIDDLIQVGSIGLLKAIDAFDPDRQTAFSTFAVPKIVGEIRRWRRDSGWAVHVPRGMQERVLQMNVEIERLSGALQRSPTPAELAASLGATLEQVLETMEAATAHEAIPLDAGPGHEPFRSLALEDENLDRVLSAVELAPQLRALPREDRQVLGLRFRDDLTQSEIAEILGMSQVQVSRVIRRALARLRELPPAAA